MCFIIDSWSALRLGDKGNSFSRLKVYNSSHLFWEQVSSKNKTVLDSIWIVTEHHGAFIAPPLPPKPTPAPTPKPSVSVKGGDNPNKATDTASNIGNNDNTDTSSGSPGSMKTFFDETSNKVLVGLGIAVVTLILILSVVIIVKKKQRIRSYRRWDATVDYGRKFYSSYSQVGKDDKEGSDFEVDSTEGNPSSKLLTEK